MIVRTPASATCCAKAVARVPVVSTHPLTCTKPSRASMPTAIASPKRRTRTARTSTLSSARVPMIARAAPAARSCSTCASLRNPPPTSTGMPIARTMRSITAVCRGSPWNAPSRSTTCNCSAPCSRQASACATGSSAYTVTSSALPCRSRTQRPSFKSIAGRMIIRSSPCLRGCRSRAGHIQPPCATRARNL